MDLTPLHVMFDKAVDEHVFRRGLCYG